MIGEVKQLKKLDKIIDSESLVKQVLLLNTTGAIEKLHTINSLNNGNLAQIRETNNIWVSRTRSEDSFRISMISANIWMYIFSCPCFVPMNVRTVKACVSVPEVFWKEKSEKDVILKQNPSHRVCTSNCLPDLQDLDRFDYTTSYISKEIYSSESLKNA
jgi:hypothetical protein